MTFLYGGKFLSPNQCSDFTRKLSIDHVLLPDSTIDDERRCYQYRYLLFLSFFFTSGEELCFEVEIDGKAMKNLFTDVAAFDSTPSLGHFAVGSSTAELFASESVVCKTNISCVTTCNISVSNIFHILDTSSSTDSRIMLWALRSVLWWKTCWGQHHKFLMRPSKFSQRDPLLSFLVSSICTVEKIRFCQTHLDVVHSTHHYRL